jgi:ABC-type Fe3+/spermidine/putrescine transport system ATPase subunit
VSFAFAGADVVHDIHLSLETGSFFALLGPSGSGKTTLLRLIGGYLFPSKGRVSLAGQDVTSLPPERRRVGMVFQNYALFPHLTARGNVAFGLEVRGFGRVECRRRVDELLDLVGLAPAERDRRPAQLSGGQQQRVALARALAIEPALLLLDEPLSDLDRRLREQLRDELAALQRRTGVTTLLVTHDQEEALALADHVGILAGGRLLQTGKPRELYEQPCCPFVASFLGEANLLTIGGEQVMVRPGAVRLIPQLEVGAASRAALPVRLGSPDLLPAGTGVGGEGDDAPRSLGTGTVLSCTFRGEQVFVRVALADTILLATVRPDEAPPPEAAVGVWLNPDKVWRIPQANPSWLEEP